jgi:hypothetical protein
MKNWCPGNPSNTGHEPTHNPAKNQAGEPEDYTFMRYEPGDEPGVDMHICKHCSLVYAMPMAKKVEAAAE